MANILLINPPRDHLVRLDLPDLVDLGEISAFPPLGLMCLAEGIRARWPDAEVSILDCVADHTSHEQAAQRVLTLRPDVVGLTSFTYTFYDVWRTASAIKAVAPHVPIVVGGPHMYIFARETMQHPCFDYGVVGDGEEVFADLCLALVRGKPPPAVPGLLSKREGVTTGSGMAQIEDLDQARMPAIDLIDPFKYYSTIGKGQAVGTICTSRGCPFQCTFCQVPRTRYRMRSIENIMEEIDAYLRLGITDFFFFDDLFNITKQRVVDFSQAVLDRNLKITWMFRGRVDQIDDKAMRLAHRAGCHTVSVGIEDATNEGLKAIRKNITIEQAAAAVWTIRKNGIKCSSNWIIGFPHQKTQADLEWLLQTAIRLDADYAQFSILQCLPGSELYDQAVAAGGIDPEAWRNYVLAPKERFSPPIWECNFTQKAILQFYTAAYRRYYLRPKVMAREVMAIRSWVEIRTRLGSFRKIFLQSRRTSKVGK